MNKEELEKALWPLQCANLKPQKLGDFKPLSPEQAQKDIDRFFRNYPPLEQFTKEMIESKNET